jgi:uncharacterized protein (TIGR02300 family)
VAKSELGTKRVCPDCGAKFYDLNRDPVDCPKCGYTLTSEIARSSARTGKIGALKSDKKATPAEVKTEPGTITEGEYGFDPTANGEAADQDDDAKLLASAALPETEEDSEIDSEEDGDIFLDEEDDASNPVTDLVSGTPSENDTDRQLE